jgi:hypothetical protein
MARYSDDVEPSVLERSQADCGALVTQLWSRGWTRWLAGFVFGAVLGYAFFIVGLYAVLIAALALALAIVGRWQLAFISGWICGIGAQWLAGILKVARARPH